MNKKVLKIIAAAVAVILIVAVLFVYNALCGNIFSAMYAKSKIERYIDKTYPNNSYEISDAKYEFKTVEYICKITDPDSEDGSFTASYSNGNVYDTYENVTNMENTLMRLEDGFREEIDPLIDRYFEDETEFGFGSVTEGKNTDRSKLYLDMKFDPKNMPVETFVTVCFSSNSAKAFTRIQEIASDLKALGYRIDYYSFSDNEKHFTQIPTDELLKAESYTDLTAYEMPDENKD